MLCFVLQKIRFSIYPLGSSPNRQISLFLCLTETGKFGQRFSSKIVFFSVFQVAELARIDCFCSRLMLTLLLTLFFTLLLTFSVVSFDFDDFSILALSIFDDFTIPLRLDFAEFAEFAKFAALLPLLLLCEICCFAPRK